MDNSHIVWRKSTLSVENGCLEFAVIEGRVAIRDSKNRLGPVLTFAPIEWKEFLDGVRAGEFDHTRQKFQKR
jgi:Domain of unknown function (DUF397)